MQYIFVGVQPANVQVIYTGSGLGYAGEGAGPAVGDKAPACSLEGSDGKSHALENHLGKRPVIMDTRVGVQEGSVYMR